MWSVAIGVTILLAGCVMLGVTILLDRGRLSSATNTELSALPPHKVVWPPRHPRAQPKVEVLSPDRNRCLRVRRLPWPSLDIMEIWDADKKRLLARHVNRELIVLGWSEDGICVYFRDARPGRFLVSNPISHVKRLEARSE